MSFGHNQLKLLDLQLIELQLLLLLLELHLKLFDRELTLHHLSVGR